MKRQILIILFLVPEVLMAQDSLSLEKCLSLAAEHNQKIKIARSQASAANELEKAAFAQYFPNFSINGTYTYINKDPRLLKNDLLLPVVPYTAIDGKTGGLSQEALQNPSVAASTFVINPATGSVITDASGNPVFQKYTYLPASKTVIDIDHAYLLNGGFTQPIFLGGKIRQTIRIAQYTGEIARNQVSLTEDETEFAVEETYWRIVSLQEKVKLAEKYCSMLSRLVHDLENIHSEGIITGNDLLKARVKENEAALMLLKARNGLELSKMSLCQMTGLAFSPTLVLSGKLDANPSYAAEYLVNEKEIEGRGELRILENGVKIAGAGEKIMLSRYLPNLVLNAGYTVMNPNLYNGLANEPGGDYNIGVALNIPVFHFGEKKHTLNAARAEKEAAQLKLDETRELLVLQLQQAVYRYNESSAKTGYANAALAQAAGNLKYTEDNFIEGILKTTDLLEAQLLWQKAKSELIDALTEQQLSYSNLKKTTGKY